MNTAKDTRASLAKQLIAGAKKHFSGAASLTFGGTASTPAQVESSLQTIVDLRAAVDAAKADTKAKVSTEEAQLTSLHGQMAAFVTFVKATFGNAPDVLADFGLKPRKAATPLTTDGIEGEEEGEGNDHDDRHPRLVDAFGARRTESHCGRTGDPGREQRDGTARSVRSAW